MSSDAQHSPCQWRLLWPKMLTVLRFRNPVLTDHSVLRFLKNHTLFSLGMEYFSTIFSPLPAPPPSMFHSSSRAQFKCHLHETVPRASKFSTELPLSLCPPASCSLLHSCSLVLELLFHGLPSAVSVPPTLSFVSLLHTFTLN